MNGFTEIELLLLLPFCFGAGLLLLPSRFNQLFSVLSALLYAVICFNLSLPIALGGNPVEAQSFAWASSEWLPKFRLDGVSAAFILLTAVVSLVVFSVGGKWYKERPKLYSFLNFAIVGLLNGAFLSRDLLLFYVFFEAVFIPVIFVLGLWGSEQKGIATLRFVLMSLVGSLLMLVSILTLGWQSYRMTGTFTLDAFQLSSIADQMSPVLRSWVFVGFLAAFAIKLPIAPLHSWLPDAYTSAPTPLTIWLSSVISKLGAIGIFRFVLPLFAPVVQAHHTLLLYWAAASIVYASFMAMRESNPKTMLAYSSVSHLGFVAFGLFTGSAEGAAAAMFLAVAHGFASAGLFAVEEARQQRSIGTLVQSAPQLSALAFVLVLAGVSLPGTANFVGEFLVLKDGFLAEVGPTVLATCGVVLGAVYMLTYFQRYFFQVAKEESTSRSDVRGFEWIAVLPCVAIILFLGLQPNIVLNALQGGQNGHDTSNH